MLFNPFITKEWNMNQMAMYFVFFFVKKLKEIAKKTEKSSYKCKVHCYLGHFTPKNGNCT